MISDCQFLHGVLSFAVKSICWMNMDLKKKKKQLTVHLFYLVLSVKYR